MLPRCDWDANGGKYLQKYGCLPEVERGSKNLKLRLFFANLVSNASLLLLNVL